MIEVKSSFLANLRKTMAAATFCRLFYGHIRFPFIEWTLTKKEALVPKRGQIGLFYVLHLYLD